ncbi:hypothetical protein GS504_01345 [Rhodococcus hoagii]|nr:hypothetical protein [Prescottella equi]NKS71682.1 hypothetical protein [Prescottella equi]
MTSATTVPARQALTLELTNTCQCEYCDDCSLVIAGGSTRCPECEGELAMIDCGGHCWASDTELLRELVAEWTSANPSESGRFWVDGEGMGWRQRSGFVVVDLDDVDPWEVVGVNSEWTQTWTIEAWKGGRLEVTQSHHDAMGECYTFRPATEAEVEMHCD